MPTVKTVKAPIKTALAKLNYSVASIGIDVSKDKLDIALLFADKSHANFVFKNNSAGVKLLIGLLKKQGTAETVPCVIESTGNYHLQSAIMITLAGFAVKVINPLITKKYQRSSIRNAKSDPIDALRLAQIGLLEPELPLFNANKDIISAKKLVSYLAHLEKTKQRLLASRKQMKQAEEYLEVSFNLDSVAEAVKAIDKQIESLKKEICARAPEKGKKLAESCRGLSEESISILLCLLMDKHFSNRDQLVAFVGLDPALRKSGKWQGMQKLSKRGEPIARKILFQIAWGLKQHNPTFKEYYDRLYRQEGKNYTTSIIAVARKFLKFLYAYYWKGTLTCENI
jgi:transposase